MIHYKTGGCIAPVFHLLQIEGSVIPKALGWAFFSSSACVLVNYYFYSKEGVSSIISSTWFSYSFLLSFLVVFRTQSAYSRYWEGASVLNAVKGDFINAASCMFAFCSNNPVRKAEVIVFQHLIVRLMSLLHCAGLQSVATMKDEAFEVIELQGLGQDSIDHLNANPEDKTLIILQWVQKLVLSNMQSGVLDVAPPIASRLFQQLGQGVIQLSAAKKISEIPFPFPYTQMVTLLLVGSTVCTPVVIGRMIESLSFGALLTFVGVFGFWAINYIAAEIEMPFGDDKNDLPIADMQIDFNKSLAILIKPLTQTLPVFDPTQSEQMHSDCLVTTKCSIGLSPIPDTNRALHVGLQQAVANAGYAGLSALKGISNTVAEHLHSQRQLSPSSVGVSYGASSRFPPTESEWKGGHQASSVHGSSSSMSVTSANVATAPLILSEADRGKLIDLGGQIEQHFAKFSSHVEGLAATALKCSKSLDRIGSSLALERSPAL